MNMDLAGVNGDFGKVSPAAPRYLGIPYRRVDLNKYPWVDNPST